MQPLAPGVCECVYVLGVKEKLEGLQELVFWMGLKRNSGQSGGRVHKEDGPMNRSELPAGRAHEFTQAESVSLCFSVCLTANNIY